MGSYAGNLTSFKFPDSRAKDAKDTRFQWKESRAKNAENAKFFPMRIWRTRINSCAVTLTLTMTMTASGMISILSHRNHGKHRKARRYARAAFGMIAFSLTQTSQNTRKFIREISEIRGQKN